jgi:hypothetical protein
MIRPVLLLWLLMSVLQLALAQVDDDFSDGDFSANPTWEGDVNLFQVNALLSLQSAGNAATETIYLSTASSQVSDTEWRIQVRYLDNPSSSNNLRVYLVSDQADLTGPLNGYFVSAGGETGTDDSYDLYRQTGNTETLLIDGVDGGANPTDAVLKVSRDGAGNWQLFVDQGGTGIFLSQGNAVDNDHLSSTHMGVVVSHTSTRADDYFVDDVYVGAPIVDLTPPLVLSADALDANTVAVQFDEALDPITAETSSRYAFDQGLMAPSQAQLDGNDPSQVFLTLASPLTNQTSYQLTVDGVADLAGNAISPAQTIGFTYSVPEVAAYRDVIFSEFMADPSPTQGLPEVEFVEIYNRSQKLLDLAGWTVGDAGSQGTLPSYLLGPGQYLIIASSASAPLLSSFGTVLSPSSLPALNNGGDDLVLKTSDSTTIDSLTYTLAWYRDETKDDGGFSLELINPENDACPAPANWRATTASNGGTPGTQNSVYSLIPESEAPQVASVAVANSNTLDLCFDEIMNPASLMQAAAYQLDQGIGVAQTAVPDSSGYCVALTFDVAFTLGVVYALDIGAVEDCSGNLIAAGTTVSVAQGRSVQPFDVVITEFMADPEPVVGLPAVDFVELYNRTNDVLDLSRFRISDAAGSAQWGRVVLFPGEYLLVCNESAAAAFAPFGRVLGVEGFPNFNNTGDSITLRSEFDEVIDYVFYSDEWYRDESRAQGGFSLERIDRDFVDCNLASNWRASQADLGGTPGQPNSVAGSFLDNLAPQLDQALALDAQTVLLFFSEPMDRATLEDESHYSLDNGIGAPSRARVTSVGNQAVSLELATPLQANLVYTLQVSGLTDCVGNALSSSVELGLSEAPAPFEVVFNEIYPDFSPSLGLPEAEFIELYNRTNKLLNLSGVTLSDGGTPAEFGAVTLFPEGYLILCGEDDVDLFRPYGRVLGLPGLPALNNSGDSLRLRNANGETLDYLFYSSAWYGSVEAAEGGVTLERVDPAFVDCNNAGNWQASQAASGGTPGEENSVRAAFDDTEGPGIVVLRPTSNGIQIEFDEQMDPATLEDPSHYEGNGGLGVPILALAQAPHFRRVELVFASPLDTNRVYELAISGLTDCSGNELVANQPFGLPVAARPGDLRLNEILFNPYSGGADFVEIVNVSDKLLDLANLRLGEALPGTDSLFNDDPISESSFVLLPGDLICLTTNVLFQRLAYRPPLTARFLEMAGFPSYDDSDGECVLFNATGEVIDRFYYEDGYHYPTLEDDDGVSLERISLQVPTQEVSNWHSASSLVGYATPGYVNSQAQTPAAGESEVSLGQQVFSPNLDGDEDVLAINYHFDFVGANARIYVYDTRGQLVRRLQENILLDPAPGTFFWDGFGDNGQKLPIGMYVILFEVTNDDTGKRQAYRRVAVLADRL